ncbi:uncharacterized protein [Periplaneta americana]|uniref:uncharacterized protein n=1 Tax=Periplaneta americana TaxID=6978 RepID=UPI0037E97EA4
MQTQMFVGVIMMAALLLMVASEWIQLPMVEPGGKIKVKQRPYDIEEDFQTSSHDRKGEVQTISRRTSNDQFEDKAVTLGITRTEATTSESLLETEASDVSFHVHLTASNMKLPDAPHKTGVSSTSLHGDDTVVNSSSENDPKISQKESKASSSAFDMLRSVHQKLVQVMPNTLREKMDFLQQLKNRMLHYMERRIRGLWTTDNQRQSRTEKGMMAFPSMEGALMSISFLIFAVFLIKLVQQLIQSLQGNNMAGMMAATTRRTRSVPDLLVTARVLQLISEFPFQSDEDKGWT